MVRPWVQDDRERTNNAGGFMPGSPFGSWTPFPNFGSPTFGPREGMARQVMFPPPPPLTPTWPMGGSNQMETVYTANIILRGSGGTTVTPPAGKN